MWQKIQLKKLWILAVYQQLMIIKMRQQNSFRDRQMHNLLCKLEKGSIMKKYVVSDECLWSSELEEPRIFKMGVERDREKMMFLLLYVINLQ